MHTNTIHILALTDTHTHTHTLEAQNNSTKNKKRLNFHLSELSSTICHLTANKMC